MLPRFLRRPKREPSAPLDEAYAALRAALDGDLPAAERALTALAHRDSTQSGAYLALGQLFRRRGEVGRAIRIHQNLLLRRDLDEANRSLAIEGLARDFEQGGFLARALGAWRELLAREPEHAGARRALVSLLAATRDFAGAEAERKRLALSGDAHDLPSACELALRAARLARSEGKLEEARRATKRALAAEPRSAPAWRLVAELEDARGRTRKALAAARRAAELDRLTPPEAYAVLARLFDARGQAREHDAFLRRLSERRPDDSGPRLALARARAAQGASADALASVEEVLARDADDLEAHAIRAELLAASESGAAAKALSELTQALARQGLHRSAEPRA